MERVILLLFLVVSLSCSPQKKLTKLIDRNPLLVDTVTVVEYREIIQQRIDTVLVVKGKDTIRSIRYEYDTLRIPVYITKNIIKTVYDDRQLNRLRRDSLTVYKRNVSLEKDLAKITARKEVKIQKSKNSWLNYLFLFLFAILVIFTIKTIYKR